MPKIKVILNPVSGSGTAGQARETIARTLDEEGAEFDIVETTGQYSAIAQARQAVREGAEIIASVGGDVSQSALDCSSFLIG